MSSGKSLFVLVVMMAAVAAAVAVAAVERKETIGECLVRCGEKVVTCAAGCGFSGGRPSCYQNCGVSDVRCIEKCIGTDDMPRTQPTITPDA